MSLKHKIEYIGVKSVVLFIGLLPNKIMIIFAKCLAFIAFYVLKIRRSVTIKNIKNAFPDLNKDALIKIGYNTYKHFGIVFLEYLLLLRMDKEEFNNKFIIKSPDTIKELMENQRGQILLSGHFGSWEALFLFYNQLKDNAGIAKKQNNPLMDEFIQRQREKFNGKLFYSNDSIKLGVDWLKAGNSLLVVGDQDARHHGIFVPFMGRPASTYTGATVFSMRARADIYFTYCIRNENGLYELYIEKMFDLNEGFGKDFVTRTISVYMQKLEAQVRQYPNQYFWMHKRWKTKPPQK